MCVCVCFQKGEVGKMLPVHNRREGWEDRGGGGGGGWRADTERDERVSIDLPVCWRNLVAHVSLVSKQS